MLEPVDGLHLNSAGRVSVYVLVEFARQKPSPTYSPQASPGRRSRTPLPTMEQQDNNRELSVHLLKLVNQFGLLFICLRWSINSRLWRANSGDWRRSWASSWATLVFSTQDSSAWRRCPDQRGPGTRSRGAWRPSKPAWADRK